MYIPKYSEVHDLKLIKSFLEEYGFATLVNQISEGISANHYPFLVDQEGEDLVLWTHLALGNPQWKSLSQSMKALVIFTGPHSYISPVYYKDPLNVPTWSYTAVHATCACEIVKDPQSAKELMKRLVETYESKNRTNWEYKLPEDFHEQLQKAIVWLRLRVTSIEAKFKLSQNRDKDDYLGVIEEFSKRTSENDKDLLRYMKLTMPEKMK